MKPKTAEHRAALSASMRRPETNAKRLASLAKYREGNGDFLKPEQVAAILADYRKRDAYAVADDWLISPHYVWELAQRHGVRKRA